MNGQSTRYALDINTGLPDVLSDGSSTYTYGLGNLSQNNGTATDYFLGDGIGSTRQLADGSGQIGLTESYDPFGNSAGSAGTESSILAYAGQQTDPSGMQFLRARHYQPTQGRFLNRDSFAGYVDLPQSLNQYMYGLNDPVRYTDPSGNFPFINAAMNWVAGGGNSPCGPSWDQMLIDGGVGFLAFMMNLSAVWNTNATYWGNFMDGARDQWADDMALGLFTMITGGDLRNNHSPGFQEGRDFGHRIAMIMAIAETVGGLIDLVITVPILVGTGIGAAACAAVTLGFCLPVGGIAITGELVLAAAGAAAVLHGGAILATRMNMERSEGGGGGGLSDADYENAVRQKTGGKRQDINGREYDSVTETKIVEAKNGRSAVDNPFNFLSQDRKRQIIAGVKNARSTGRVYEVWFPQEPHWVVRNFIENAGGTVVVWSP